MRLTIRGQKELSSGGKGRTSPVYVPLGDIPNYNLALVPSVVEVVADP